MKIKHLEAHKKKKVCLCWEFLVLAVGQGENAEGKREVGDWERWQLGVLAVDQELVLAVGQGEKENG